MTEKRKAIEKSKHKIIDRKKKRHQLESNKMIPSVQFQSCNDTLTTIQKDYLEKFDMPVASSLNSDNDIQLSDQTTQFDSDQILMHQIEFSDSDIAISQDCHSIELETSDEMIAACDDTQNIINYTIIGNGLILIEGSQMDFDDETKDSSNDLKPINGALTQSFTFFLPFLWCRFAFCNCSNFYSIFIRYRFIGNGKK